MVCTKCRENEDEECYDTQHPQQDYRGCACQHQARREVTGTKGERG